MKVTNEIRSAVFNHAYVLFSEGAETFGEALTAAWKTIKTAIAVLVDKKAIITNFVDALRKTIYAFQLKKEMEAATETETFVSFAYVAGVGTNNERVRSASGCAITKANYEFVGNGRTKPSHIMSYFDAERNAPRNFRIENLILPK